MIKIKNLRRNQPSKDYDIKVDRSSPLGNPFYMEDESKRDKVCDKYHIWFYKDKHKIAFYQELFKLKETYKKFGKLNLFCWCNPKRCHAETIKQYLEESK